MQPTHLCVCHLFSIYQTYGKLIFSTTQSVSRVFMQFSIFLNRLLFEINLKNRSLRWNRRSLLEIITYCFNSVTEKWKSTRSVIILIRSRSSANKLYFFSFYIFLFNNFDVSFLFSLTILVWYIHQNNYKLYLVIN